MPVRIIRPADRVSGPPTPGVVGPRTLTGTTNPNQMGVVAPPSNKRRWVIVVIAIVFATLGNLAIALLT